MKTKIILILFLIIGKILLGCSSFAFYGNTILYGMNFDYPDREMLFKISEGDDDITVFKMGFLDEEGHLRLVFGYNNHGVMGSCQYQYPWIPGEKSVKKDEITIFSAWNQQLHNYKSVSDFLDYLSEDELTLIQNQGSSLHNLFADKEGNAIVLEASDKGNRITKQKNGFLVMTNFCNYVMADISSPSSDLIGSERYKDICDHIEENNKTFTMKNAWECLEKSAQTSGKFLTQCSAVFDPINNLIYLVLDREFSKIWQVDLNNQTMKTFKGFATDKMYNLDEKGITSSQLFE